MNRILLAAALFVTATCPLAAEPPVPAPADPHPAARLVGPGDIYPLWTIVGEWRVTHPDWTGVIRVQADGTVVNPEQASNGRWSLGAEGGTPLLVIRWDRYGTESFAMITPNHFRAQIRPECFSDMRRGE